MKKLQISLSADSIIKQIVDADTSSPLYDIRHELWTMRGWTDEPTPITACYNKAGQYIGDYKTARYLCETLGIAPEVSKTGHSVCSIGFSEKDGKWYGWSHRAHFGFKAGDTVKPGDCAFTDERGTWTAQTQEDAKQMAKDFAESVSSVQRIRVQV